jgi:phosphatidylglycerophosphate synthase
MRLMTTSSFADLEGIGVREIKARTLKPVDACWTVFVIDPIAVRVIWVMARLRIKATPEGITWASLALGVASGAAFAGGRYVWGALLYEASFLLDCLDGKWSRLTQTSTGRGAFLDGLVGTLVLVAAVTGLGYHEGIRADGGLAIVGACLLLSVRAMNNYLTIYLRAEDKQVHTVFRTGEKGFLARHRLLAPMAFPDRHALLFVVAPLMSVVGPMFVAVGALEFVMQLRKWQLVWRQMGAPEIPEMEK